MPPYASAAAPTVGAQHGIPQLMWNAEQPAPGNGGAAASQAVALPDTSYNKEKRFDIDGFFSGAPGAFEIDVQVAPNDVDTQYQTLPGGNMVTVDAINNTFHFSPQFPIAARFMRLLMRARANAVNVTATVTP